MDAVEPVIGHLKGDYRMIRNYLKGVEGGMINTIMAAASFNMMKKLRQIRDIIYFVLDWLARYWSIKYITVTNYCKTRLVKGRLFNLGYETAIERFWQHFCEEIYFQYDYPFDPRDFVQLCKRIREEGMKKIFKQSKNLFGKEKIQQR